MSEDQAPTIDRCIYVMPMFTTLVVQSLAESEAFFHQLDFHIAVKWSV